MTFAHPWRFEHCVVSSVVDGDTIDASIDCGFGISVNKRLRLARINAPEVGQPGADKATHFLQNHALHKPVIIETKRTDDYGRFIAEIYADGVNLNDVMLQRKLVEPYPKP